MHRNNHRRRQCQSPTYFAFLILGGRACMCRRQETPSPIVKMLPALPMPNLNPQLETGNIGNWQYSHIGNTSNHRHCAPLHLLQYVTYRATFARCCFRIAASLLVFTSPMTSPLALLCQSYCVNGAEVPVNVRSASVIEHTAYTSSLTAKSSARADNRG